MAHPATPGDLPICLVCADWVVGNPACGKPAIAIFIFSCVHEHFDRVPVCADCRDEIQLVARSYPAFRLICRFCEEGPEPHECPQHMTLGVTL